MSICNPTPMKHSIRKRVAWNSQEDNVIKNWVITNGVGRWAECSKMLLNKTKKQCRDRWSYVLNPNINRDKLWGRIEDYILIKLYLIFGSRWAKISRYLLGRAPIQIKNRFNSIMRGKNFDWSFDKLIINEFDKKRVLCYLHTYEIDHLIQSYIEPSNTYNILIEIISILENLEGRHSNEKARFFELLSKGAEIKKTSFTELHEMRIQPKQSSKLGFSLAHELADLDSSLHVIHQILKNEELTKII